MGTMRVRSYQSKGCTKVNAKDERIVKELFTAMDKDKSGVLSDKELKMGLRCVLGLNPTETEMKQIYKEMGVKQGQEIDFNKFRECLLKYVERAKEKGFDREAEAKTLKRAFEVFDKNCDGGLDRCEFKMLLDSLGEQYTEQEIDCVFNAADTQKDGKLDYNEFIRIFLKDIKMT
ncbi:calmodulin-like 3 [Mactra antiquata]